MNHLFNVCKNGGVKMARFAFMRVGGNEWDYFLAGKINFLECLLVD